MTATDTQPVDVPEDETTAENGSGHGAWDEGVLAE